MKRSRRADYRVTFALSLAVASALPHAARAATPIIVQNEAGFEGLEEPKVIYFPDSNTFENDPTNYQNHVDEGGGMFRDTLRNEYPSPLAPYAAGPGWWDGDGADAGNTDRQRSEPKGIVGLGHQQVEQTFEYSFDFRTDPTFHGTSNFCHIFQLKATNGDDSPPLATISLYKNGSGIQGRVDCFTDGTSGTPQTEIIPTTFSYAAGQWAHFDIRITPCAQGESTGQILLSVNGGAFAGITNAAIDLQGSTDFRPKFGFYRGMSTTNGAPVGDSWVEHRTIAGLIGTSNVLTWKGGLSSNAWDTNTTANFLNSSASSVFNIDDQVNFDNTSGNTSVNLSGTVAPNYIHVNSSQNYSFGGTGSITGGATLRKDGTGTLTLSTSNSYQGLTDVRAGVLFVTGSIGNNSLTSVTGGTLRAGSSAALGTNATIGTQIDGGALDINGFNLSTEPISVDGTGVGGAGAIVNTGAQQTSALTNVTLTGDTTLGGSGRWDIRGTGAKLSTGGGSFNLTKTGSNEISLVGATVDSALGNITINQGVLAFQTSTTSMGDPTTTVTINSGGILDFYNTSNVMTKLGAINGGTIWGESGTGTQNTFAGPITLGSAGGTFDAGSALTGGTPSAAAVLTVSGNIAGSGSVTKTGPGLVTFSGSNAYTGNTTVSAGTLVLNQSFTTGAALSIATGTVMKLPTSGLVLKIKSLSITGTGSLDLNTGAMIVDYTGATPLANIRTLLQQGYSNATWTGSGLTSTQAAAIAADPANHHKTALGYAEASSVAVGSIPGQTLDNTSVVVRYTLAGDANLDQVVDTSDFTSLAASFDQSGRNWFQGDFNYDGVVNALDFNILASNFGASLSSPALESLVPEPSSAIVLVAPLLLRRRRITARRGS